MPSILLPAVFFLMWDVWFTKIGVWGFNPDYLLGIYFFGLPIEEVLFFICIPYACVFTYEAVGHFSKKDYSKSIINVISILLIVILLIIALLNIQRAYTFATLLFCASFLLYVHFKIRPTYLGKFYLSFLFILIPFFIVNGVLTGTGIEGEVVWYNNSENLGMRMGTIPVEDTFYGMLLILMNVTIFETLQEKKKP